MRSIVVLVLACMWGFAAQTQETPGFDVPQVIEYIATNHYPKVDIARCEQPLTEVLTLTDFADKAEVWTGNLYLRSLDCFSRFSYIESWPYAESPFLRGPLGFYPPQEEEKKVVDPNWESWEIMPSGETLYLRIRSFLYSSSEFEEGMKDLQTRDGGLKSFSRIVLDLRNNKGGRIQNACELLSWFPEPNAAESYLEYNNGSQAMWPNCVGIDSFADEAEVTVIINETTVSAGEFVAAVLEERGAILIGTRTFGKGVGQIEKTFGPLDVRIVVGEFHYSTGETYDGKGIEPLIQSSFPGCNEDMLCLLSHVSTDLALYQALAGSAKTRAAELGLQTAVVE